jgi:TolA-binding protein
MSRAVSRPKRALYIWGSSCGGLLRVLSLALLLLPARVFAQQLVENIADSRTQYAHATGLLRREFYDLAEPQFRLFIARYPEDALVPQARLYLIECLRGQNKTDAMLQEIGDFKEKYPDNGNHESLTLLEADTHFNRERYDAAAQLFAGLFASKERLRAEQARYFWGQCQLKLDRAEEAATAFRVLASEPFAEQHVYRPYAVYYLGWLALRRARYSEAVANFTRLQAGSGIAEGLMENASYRLAEALLAAGRDDEALQAYEKYIASFPDGQFGQEARRRRIELLGQAGEHARVVALGNEWLQLYPGSAEHKLLFVFSQALLETGDYERAQFYFERLGNEPAAEDELRRLARAYTINCLFMAGQYAVVDDYAQAFLTDFPTAAERGNVLLWQARAALESQRFADAEKAARAATAFFQDDLKQSPASTELLVLVLSKQEKWSEAAALLRALADREGVPDSARLRMRAAEIAYQVNDFAQAEKDCLFLVENYPEEKELLRTAQHYLLRISLDNKDFANARRHAEELLLSAPLDEQLLLTQTLAVLHYNQGDSDAAIAVLQAMLNKPGLEEGKLLSIKVFLGRILLESQQLRSALPVFAELLSSSHQSALQELLSPGILYQLGGTADKLQDYALAEQAWQALIARQDEIWTTRAQLRLAQTLNLKGQPEQSASKLWDLEKSLVTDSEALAQHGQELYSLLAEMELQLGHHDQALLCAGKALKSSGTDDARHLTRARWVTAKVLFEDEKSPSQALPYAVKCFILADDDGYSPRAMLLATRIFLALGRRRDALATWHELAGKYPTWAETQRSQDYVKELLATEDSGENKKAP